MLLATKPDTKFIRDLIDELFLNLVETGPFQYFITPLLLIPRLTPIQLTINNDQCDTALD